MKMKQLVCAALTLCICVGLALPAMGASDNNNSDSEYDNICTSEEMLFEEEITKYDFQTKPVLKFDYNANRGASWDSTEQKLITTRRLNGPMSVSEDRKIIGDIRVVIAKNATLTIEEGTTLTVNGTLLIRGTLINKGTIVVAYNGKPEKKELIHAMLAIDPGGKFTNNGALTVKNGSLETAGNITNSITMDFQNSPISNMGTIENTAAGKITMTNDDKALRCFQNTSMHRPDKVYRGSIDNKGDIEITTTAEVAVYSEKECTIANSGRIAVSKDAAVKGAITGNKHVLLK